VDSSTLRRVAREGLASVNAQQLTDLALWCRDYAEASGDARYASIGAALKSLDDWRTEYDEAGGIPADLIAAADRLVTTRLPAILDAEDPADASALARTFREETEALLLPPERWPGA
jgi:hypothetical protein